MLGEVTGVGILYLHSRAIVGYADLAWLECAPSEPELAVCVGESKIFLGAAAEREALVFPRKTHFPSLLSGDLP